MGNYDIDTLFQDIRNDKELENFFFTKLYKSNNFLNWFQILNKNGYFSPQNNPAENKYWNVIGYFERISNYLKQNLNNTLEIEFVSIIDNIINYKKVGNKIRNFYTDINLIKFISDISSDKFNKKYLRFIKELYDFYPEGYNISHNIEIYLTTKIIKINDPELTLEFIRLIFGYKIEDKNFHNIKSIIDDFYLENIINKYGSDFYTILNNKLINYCVKLIKEITFKAKYTFSYVSISTVEDSIQRNNDTYEELIFNFTRDNINKLTNTNKEKYIIRLLKEDHIIFKRLVVYLININYQSFKRYFWNNLVEMVNTLELTHEVYELLKNNCSFFDDKEILKLLENIEKIDYSSNVDLSRYTQEEITKIMSNRKRELLMSLSSRSDKIINEYIKKYESIDNSIITHPGFLTYHGVEVGARAKSDIAPDELNKKTIDEIIDHLNNFKPDYFENINPEGLSGTLSNAIKFQPEKYKNELDKYYSQPFSYQLGLFNGFIKYFDANNEYDIIFLFDYFIKYFKDVYVWRTLSETYSSREWLISAIAEFVETKTKKDDNPVGKDLFSKFKEILIIFSKHTNYEPFDSGSEIVNIVLNNWQGKIYSAIVNWCLQNARVFKVNEPYKWDEDVKKEFENKFNRGKDESLEFYTLLGEYLRNYMYLDKEWVVGNFNKIFPVELPEHWECAISGYFFFNPQLFKDIYKLFKENGHLDFAIDFKFRDYYASERLAEYLCIAYFMNDNNTSDDDLLIKYINKNSSEILSIVIRSVNVLYENTDLRVKLGYNKLKIIWKLIFDICNYKKSEEEYQKVFTNLNDWISFTNIANNGIIEDDVFDWLKISLKYVEKYFNSMHFIEKTSQLVKQNPLKIGELFYIVLEKSRIKPNYPEKKIIEIVEELYKSKIAYDWAIKISNLYGENDFYFLRDLYNKYKVPYTD